MIQKRLWSLSTKVNTPLYDVVKIRVIITENVNIFTIYETFDSIITIFRITYQSKTKMPGQKGKCLVYLQEVASYINYIQAI